MTAWLLDTLLYTGLLIALILVLRRPIGKWFGPQIAYALWALPFLRLLLPPIVLPASLAPEPAAAPVAAQAAAPMDWVAAAPLAAAAKPDTLPAASAAPAWELPELGAVLLSVWFGGVLAFLAWRVVTYRQMRRELLAKARPVGEVGKIRLVETPALAAPVAFGVRDKVIGLPPLFMAQPDTTARDLAIAHELAHHRGHDLLANFAAQALLALHWFNPLAWYGWRAMRRDQEAACDARVVAGRAREERVLYAALIADIAAGPRLALAAPMACPVLGDKSIIHRLKSLASADMSPRRRLLGRGLVGAAALALPLTASISYAAASVQAPEASALPEAPEAVAASVAPVAPIASDNPVIPDAAQTGETGAHHFAAQDGPIAPVAPVAAVTPRSPAAPLPPSPPNPPQFNARDFGPGPEFEARMEAWGREMEKWGEEWGENWGRQYAEQARAQAAEARAQAAEGRAHAAAGRAQALAYAEAARHQPEVIESCDPKERRRTTTNDGRQRVVICEREIRANALAGARASLRGARASIAANPELSEEVRRDVLRDLDEEIERIERED